MDWLGEVARRAAVFLNLSSHVELSFRWMGSLPEWLAKVV
jgi:hypothetical protein